jgi:HEAT repeat protein
MRLYPRTNILTAAALLGFLFVGCRTTGPLETALRNTRPELRAAVRAMSTPTRLGGNYGDDVQVAARLEVLLVEMHFKPENGDQAVLKVLMTKRGADPYSRICAAYFLLGQSADARSLLTNYLASTNLRERFNAARAVQFFASGATGEPCDWADVQMVRMIENRSLEITFGTQHYTLGFDREGSDALDDGLTPITEVIRTLGELKERRAIPGLKSLIERNYEAESAASALGQIGDPSVGPLLLSEFDRTGSLDFADALASLQYRPAVPSLLNRLRRTTNSYEGTALLEDLLRMGDASVLPEMENYLQSLPSSDETSRKAGLRILAQMRDKDPVQSLVRMLAEEKNNDDRVELIRALGRYPDQRAIATLAALAVSSDFSRLRRNAIWTLEKMGGHSALLALVSVLETNAPPPVEWDKPDILNNRPPDISRKEALSALQTATHQDFGLDADKWRRWANEQQ